MEFALPGFLLDEKNQLYLLAMVFTSFIIGPMIMISRHEQTGEPEDPEDWYDKWENKQIRKKNEKKNKKLEREIDDWVYENDPDV